MNYFFPSPIPSLLIKQSILPELKYTVNSGTNALRVLLRSFEFPKDTKIAIPSYVCSAVKHAVTKENLVPVSLDLKNGHTFWTHYDLEKIKTENSKAIVLVHLYGFIHPDSEEIIKFCKANDIKLIHDAAQSFGVDENCLEGDGIIYSFGPGKSTTAAGGAIIKRYNANLRSINLKTPSFFSFQNIRSKLFLKSRIVGYTLNKVESFLNSVIHKLPHNEDLIFTMDQFQLEMASYVVSNFETIKSQRKNRYTILLDKIKANSFIEILPSDNLNGLYFKMILFIKEDVNKFKMFLSDNHVPYFCLADCIEKNAALVNFTETAERIVELSCEASIPEDEIVRVAEIVSRYK